MGATYRAERSLAGDVLLLVRILRTIRTVASILTPLLVVEFHIDKVLDLSLYPLITRV